MEMDMLIYNTPIRPPIYFYFKEKSDILPYC